MAGRRRLIGLLLFVFLFLLFQLLPGTPASAQDGGPPCPPGFHFEPNSGVGCVQTNCLTIPNAKYNAGQRCICNDGFHVCSQPVDSSNVDCGPFCPPVVLTACVPADTACPEQGSGTGPSQDGDSGFNSFLDSLFSDPSDSPGQEGGISSLLSDLEDFLADGQSSAPSPGKAAAGAASVAALLSAWVISQLLAGRPAGDVLGTISRWRKKSGAVPKVEKEGNGKTAEPEPKAEKPKPKPGKPKSEPPKTAQTPEKVEAPPKESAPSPEQAAPPDLPTLKRKFTQEKLDAQKKIDFYRLMQVLLDQEYRRLYTDWEVARRSAPVEGVIDIGDLWLSMRGGLKVSSVKGAYGKDLLKRTIKGLFRKWVRYRQDGSFQISPNKMLSGAYKSIGLKSPPSGAFKKIITNLMQGKGLLGYGKFSSTMMQTFGTDLSRYYSAHWKIKSLLKNTTNEMVTTQDLRQKMTNLRDLFNRVTRDLETAQTDLDLANSGLQKVDGDIAELKKAFPYKFRDL